MPLEKVRTPLLLLFSKWEKQIEKSLAEQLHRKTQAAPKHLKCGSYTPQTHPMTTTETAQAQTCWEIPLPREERETGTSGILFAHCCWLQLRAHCSVILQCNPLGMLRLFPAYEHDPEINDVSLVAGWEVWQVARVGWLLLPKSLLWGHRMISFKHYNLANIVLGNIHTQVAS